MKAFVVILAAACLLELGALILTMNSMIEMAQRQVEQSQEIRGLQQNQDLFIKIIEGTYEPAAAPGSTI